MGNTIQKKQFNYRFLQKGFNYPTSSFKKQFQCISQNISEKYINVKYGKEEIWRRYCEKFTNYLREAQVYEWRNLTTKPIIKINYVEVIKHTAIPLQLECIVFTQNLLSTLHDMSNLNCQQTLYLLISSINGFQAIFRLLGYVSIHPKCIGINFQKQCKVWINSNFSLNIAEDCILKIESEIVYAILRVIRQYTFEICQYFFIKLQKHLDLTKNVTFLEVLKFTKQYAFNNKITIPSIFQFKNVIKDLSPSKTFKKTSKISQLGAKSSEQFYSPNKYNISLRFSEANRSQIQSRSVRLETDRKTSMKKSNFSNVTCKKKQLPKFLQKNNKCAAQKKSPIKQNCLKNKKKVSLILSQQNSYSSRILIDQIKQSKRGTQNNIKNQSAQPSTSINCIYPQIKKYNGVQSEQSKSQKSMVQFSKSHKICYSHQYSINIINESVKNLQSNWKQYNQRSYKKISLISNQQTNFKSINSQIRNKIGGSTLLQRDCIKQSQPFSSHLLQKKDNQAISDKYKNKQSNHSFDEFLSKFKSPDKFMKSTVFDKQHMQDKQNQLVLPDNLFQTNDTFGKNNKRKFKKTSKQYQEQQFAKVKQEQILNANSWKKKIVNLIDPQERNFDNKLNFSIHCGDEKQRIVTPKIKLQKLQKIGRQIKESVIPN